MKTFFTPGPSQLYPTITTHIQKALGQNIPSISHRSTQFQQITKETIADLRNLLSIPKDYRVFFLSSATEAMERIIENCVIDKSFHLIAGDFGKKFYEIALSLKKNALYFQIDAHEKILNNFEIPHKTELICITQNETSNGWCFPPEQLFDIKKKHQNILIAIDIVSSVPYINLDYHQIDLAFFSVQKGMGLPAGLGICIVSPQAFEKALYMQKSGIHIGSYHSFLQLGKYISDFQTPETPNVLSIFLLQAVLKDFLTVGIKNIRKETEQKASLIYTFLDNQQFLSAAIPFKETRSKTVIVASGDRLFELRDYLDKKKLIIGEGYGKTKNSQIRIANFPSHTVVDMQTLLLAIETFYK